MKRLRILYAIDAALVALGIASFGIGGAFVYIFPPMAVAAISYTIMDDSERKSLKEKEAKLLEAKKANRRPNLKESYQKSHAILCNEVQNSSDEYIHEKMSLVGKQMAEFEKKERALNTIVALDDENKVYLTDKSTDAYEVLVRNYRSFVRAMLAYSATKNDGSCKQIDKICKANQALLGWYDDLIGEVSRMGTDFDGNDAGLQEIVEKLKTLRTEAEDKEEESDSDIFKINWED